jgi:L-xylulokinase
MDMRKLCYDAEVMDAFGVSGMKDKLPPIRRSGEICGRVTKKAAAETGLVAGTPVAGGLIDIAACAIGTGITGPEKLCAIAGSWSINEYIGTAPVQHRDLWMTTAYCMPGYWLTIEGSAASAGNLEWILAELMPGESRDAKAAGGSVFETVNGMVGSIAPSDSEVLFLPFLFGSSAGSKVRGGFLGLHASHQKAHLLRAAYEGVAFAHKTDIERLLTHRGPAQAVRLAGGAAKSSVWVQIFADVLQLPIELTACEELGTMGAAICAGVGVGLFASFEEAAGRMVQVSRIVEPGRGNRDLYQDRYGRYLRTIEALNTV